MPVMVSVFQIANPEYASIVSFSVLFLYPLWTPLLLFVSCVSEKEEDFSVLPACFTIQLSPMLCRVVISYNMLNVSLILLIFLRSIF